MVQHIVVNISEMFAYVGKVVSHVDGCLADDVWSHNLLNFPYLGATIRLLSCLSVLILTKSISCSLLLIVIV